MRQTKNAQTIMHVRTENVSIHVQRMIHVLLLQIVKLLVISLFAHVRMDTLEIQELNANYVSKKIDVYSIYSIYNYFYIILRNYKQPPLFL